MHRIDTATKAADLFGAGKDGFKDGNKSLGIDATDMTAAFFNDIQENIARAIEDAGFALVKGDYTQLSVAVRTLFQKASAISAAASGTVDAITANFTPAIVALSDHLRVFVRAGGANTLTNPTFTPNSASIAAKTIVKGHNQALVAGDISGAGFRAELQYDLTLDKWVLLNPATGVNASSGNFSGLNSTNISATLALSDLGKLYAFYGSTAGQTLTLPAVASVQVGKNAIIVNQASVAVTVKGNAAENISSNTAGAGQTLANTMVLNPGDSIILSSNGGTQWNAWGYASPGQFPNLKTANGYLKLPNGLIIQWGIVTTSASSTTAVTFPVAFPSTVISIATGCSQGTLVSTTINAQTATGMNVDGWAQSGARTSFSGVYWIAIGY